MKQEKIIQRKIITKKCLSPEEQLLLFDFEDSTYWIRKYVRNYKLASPAIEKKMILLRDVALLNAYWRKYDVKSETLAFLFELGDEELLKPCLKHNLLPSNYQGKLLELNNEKLLKVYFDFWYLEGEPEIKFIQTCTRKTLQRYLRHHTLSQKAEVALIERNDDNILSYYVSKHQLCNEAKEKMYEINNINVVRYYAYSWIYPKQYNKSSTPSGQKA